MDFEKLDYEVLYEYVFELINALEEKKYYEVNYFPVTALDNRPCLQMYTSEAKYFCRDLKRNGFACEVSVLKNKKSMCYVHVFRDGVCVSPLVLLDVVSDFKCIK